MDALLRSDPAGEEKSSSAAGDVAVRSDGTKTSFASFNSAAAWLADTARDGLGLMRLTGVAGGLLTEVGLRKPPPRAPEESLATLEADFSD